MTDTSPAAQAVQLEILRAMSSEQRIMLAFEMSEFARELAREGIRRDHPEWAETEVTRELIRWAFLPSSLPAWLGEQLTRSSDKAQPQLTALQVAVFPSSH